LKKVTVDAVVMVDYRLTKPFYRESINNESSDWYEHILNDKTTRLIIYTIAEQGSDKKEGGGKPQLTRSLSVPDLCSPRVQGATTPAQAGSNPPAKGSRPYSASIALTIVLTQL